MCSAKIGNEVMIGNTAKTQETHPYPRLQIQFKTHDQPNPMINPTALCNNGMLVIHAMVMMTKYTKWILAGVHSTRNGSMNGIFFVYTQKKRISFYSNEWVQW